MLCGCDPSTPFEHEQFIDQRGLFSAQFDGTGKKLIVSSVDAPSGLWQTDPPAQLFRWHLGGDTNSAFDLISISHNGAVGATVSDSRLATWNAVTGRNKHFVQLPKKPQSIVLSNDGRWLLITGIRQIICLDTDSGKVIRSFDIDQDILGANFVDDDRHIGVYTADQKLARYDLDSQTKVYEITLPTLKSAHLVRVAESLAIAHKGGIYVWFDGLERTATLFKTDRLNQGVVISVAKTLASGELVASSNTGKLFHWRRNGELKDRIKLDMPKKFGRGQARVLAIAEAAPNQLLLAGSHGRILTLSLLSGH